MKNITKFLLTVGLSIFILTSCNNSGNNKTSEKELELQKKELDLKQKEVELKEKQLAMDSINKAKQQNSNQVTQKNVELNNTNTMVAKNAPLKKESYTYEYNFEKHNDINIFFKDLQKAVLTQMVNYAVEMINVPLIDTYGDNPGNNSKSLGCRTTNDVYEKYDLIFTKGIISAIQKKKYRAGTGGQDAFEKGEYGIEGDGNIDGDSPRPHIMLAIKKINGIYKIYAIKFNS